MSLARRPARSAAISVVPDLMDLEMPIIDRWEPVRTLKSDPHTRDIPIIGLSAYALDSRRHAVAAAVPHENRPPGLLSRLAPL
jgi:CheY-like chemotaxis protein